MDRDLRDDMLKLVRYKVLFVKREYEHAFAEQEDLLSENLDESGFTAWKTAEFIQQLASGQTKVPGKWAARGYPGDGYAHEGLLLGLEDADKKYLRVFYEVMDRYPRESFEYEEEQIKVLEQIRDNLKCEPKQPDGDVDPLPQPGTLNRDIKAHAEQVNSVAFSPDGSLLASGSADMTVKLWDVKTGEQRVAHQPLINGQAQPVTSVAFSPSGNALLRGHHADPAFKDSIENVTLIPDLEFVGHEGWVPVATFSWDGTRVATASLDLTARLWDAHTGEPIVTLTGHDDTVSKIGVGVWGVAFSRDGKTVATGASDRAVILWDAETGELRNTLQAHNGLVFSVAFSPDGKTLASGSEDTTVILWNVETNKLRVRLKGHVGWIVCVAFSPDGQTVASAAYDGTVRLWNVTAGTVQRELRAHEGAVHFVAFSPDGRLLASAGQDGRVILWNL